MKWIFFSVAFAAVSVLLVLENSAGTALRSELEQHRLDRAALEMARRESARLLAVQPTAEELAQLRRAVAERAERQRANENGRRERREEQSFPLGEWFPQTQCGDRGQSTPTATVQTLLWASAG